MLKSRCFILTLLALSGFVQAQSPHSLPDNEKICMATVGKLLAQQHVIFSDSKVDPDIRRAAERAIDTTRKAFSENASYCQAQEVLQAYQAKCNEDFHFRDGEVNYFGRGDI